MQTAHACARRRSTALSLALALLLAATAVVAGAAPTAGSPPSAAAGGGLRQGAAVPGFGEPGIPVRPASERYVREAYAAAN